MQLYHENNFQDVDWVREKAKEDIATSFKSGHRRSISALFRDLRKNRRYFLLGDYLVFWSIADAIRQLQQKYPKKEFSYALRQSKEYREIRKRERMQWAQRLYEISNSSSKTAILWSNSTRKA